MAKKGKRHKGLLMRKLEAIKVGKPQLKEPSRKKSAEELQHAQQQARQAHSNGPTKQARLLRGEKYKGSHFQDFS